MSATGQPAPRCSHCGSRLFLESDDGRGGRLYYYMVCSACSRQYQLSGDPVPHVRNDNSRLASREFNYRKLATTTR